MDDRRALAQEGDEIVLVGEWRDDVPNGYGTRYSADGQSYAGLWQGGCFRDGSRWATVGVSAERCGFR